ncbi:MAG: hypothetical protein ACTHMJ_22175 [Thermomicrobiales bacterium]
MKNHLTPGQKKALSYRKDHRNGAEYPYGFRHSWPLKKAHANRKYRRQVRQHVSQARQSRFADNHDDLTPLPVRRDSVKKRGAIPLENWIHDGLMFRIQRIARVHFRYPCDGGVASERFIRFLTTLVQGRTEQSRQLALYFNELLDPPELPVETDYVHSPSRARRDWLKAFFNDEPDCEHLLRNWIASFAAGQTGEL